MSVIVKGMEMPKNCYDCPFIRASYADDYYCVAGDGIEEDLKKLYEHRMADCPLIEIPTPHGRLIDLDKMVDEYWDGSSMRIGKTDIKDIEEYDVIIEAEGSKE